MLLVYIFIFVFGLFFKTILIFSVCLMLLSLSETENKNQAGIYNQVFAVFWPGDFSRKLCFAQETSSQSSHKLVICWSAH